MATGVMTYKNGDEYAGDFIDDLYDGYSLMKYANGDTFCGDFLKGKRFGKAPFFWFNLFLSSSIIGCSPCPR